MFSQKNDVIVRFVVVFLLCAIMMSGCASAYKSVLPKPPDQYQKIGEAKGTACGSMLIDGTAYNFIPILLNDRVERAYSDLLANAGPEYYVTDIQVSERWTYAFVGTVYCTDLQATAYPLQAASIN